MSFRDRHNPPDVRGSDTPAAWVAKAKYDKLAAERDQLAAKLGAAERVAHAAQAMFDAMHLGDVLGAVAVTDPRRHYEGPRVKALRAALAQWLRDNP